MKNKILPLLFVLWIFNVQGTTWTVTNNGNTFSPATITIGPDDSVLFVISNSHDALEISQETWDANGTTAQPGGFAVPFGGGLLVPADMGIGTHYYICQAHASMGMKGQIIVEVPTDMELPEAIHRISIYPNPCNQFLTISSGYENCHYIISDIAGRPVKSALLVKGDNVVEMTALPSGFYFVRIIERPSYRLTLVKH